MIPPERTFLGYLAEIGIAGQISIVVFFAGTVFAGLIHFRRLDFRYRAAFLPFSLLPLIIGIFGLSVGSIHVIDEGLNACITGGRGIEMLAYFGEILQIMPLVSLETIILLSISCLLFMSGGKLRSE